MCFHKPHSVITWLCNAINIQQENTGGTLTIDLHNNKDEGLFRVAMYSYT